MRHISTVGGREVVEDVKHDATSKAKCDGS